MKNARVWTLLGMVLVAVALRMVRIWPNFAPVGAMALFCGATFTDRRLAFAVPLAAMLLSDVFLGYFVYGYGFYHQGMPYVYAAFVLTTAMGLLLRGRRSPLSHAVGVGVAAVASAILFFLISNLSEWAHGTMYPRTFAGLVNCYQMAIPFFRYTLAGNLVYSALLFGGFAIAQRYVEALRDTPHLTGAGEGQA